MVFYIMLHSFITFVTEIYHLRKLYIEIKVLLIVFDRESKKF